MSAGAAAIAAKAAAALLSDERGRKILGWILLAVFAPLILMVALLCGLGAGAAEHNNAAVDACFYGAAFSEKVPAEFKDHVSQMQKAFSKLDDAVETVNENMESASLDPILIKAVFYALCFGEDAPSRRAASRFVGCFYTLEERTGTEEETASDSHTAEVPCSLNDAYAALAIELGREITADDRANIQYIYDRIAGRPESGTDGITDFELGGYYEPGGDGGTVIDISG